MSNLPASSRLTPATTPKKDKSDLHRSQRIAAYLFSVPAMIFYSLFFVFPVVFSLYISFKSWDMLVSPFTEARWTGWRNYQFLLFEDALFRKVLGNTLVYAFGSVFLVVGVALTLAFVMSRLKGKTVWRTLYFLPAVTTVVAVGQIWSYLYDQNFGLINSLLSSMGIARQPFIGSPDQAMPSLLVVALWAGMGTAILIFSAGLEGISEELYEASRIDGASQTQEFWFITLPLLRPTILFVMITSFIGGLQAFALPLIMTQGGPADSTRVLAQYMYDTAFSSMRMGRASAMVFILFVIILIVTLVQLRVFRRGGVEQY